MTLDYDPYNALARPQASVWPKTPLVGRQLPHAHSARLHGRRRHNALYTYRLLRELTQENLAAKAGVTRKTIHAIEHQKSTPSVYVALAIAEALDLSVSDVFFLR